MTIPVRAAVIGALGLALLAGCGSSAPARADEWVEPAGAVVLTVRIASAASSDGWIAVAAYGSADSFAERSAPAAAARLEVAAGEAVWQTILPRPGRYALAAFHDLDADGELDRTAFGVPDEPYGFSNDARGRFGPPSFEAAAVELRPGAAELTITLR